MNRRKKLQHEREEAKSAAFRISLESESGYSSCSSVMSHEKLSQKLLSDHSYGAILSKLTLTNTQNHSEMPLEGKSESKFDFPSTTNYTDYVEELKVSDDEGENKHTNHVAEVYEVPACEGMFIQVNNEGEKNNNTTKNRNKTRDIEPAPENVPLRKSRRLSKYYEKPPLVSEEKLQDFPSTNNVVKNSIQDEKVPLKDFSKTDDRIEPLKLPFPTTQPIKQRRQSHCIERNKTIFNIDKKKITRRKSVYVEIFASREKSSEQHVERKNPKLRRSRRQSISVERIDLKKISDEPQWQGRHPQATANNTMRTSRRQSVSGEPNGYRKFLFPQKPEKLIQPLEPVHVHAKSKSVAKRKVKTPARRRKSVVVEEKDGMKIVEEFIEEIWFVSLVTIEKQSVMRFLVKWDGNPISENTYEPLEHVKHCDVLQEYIKRKYNHHQEQLDALSRKFLNEEHEKYKLYLKRSKASIVKKLCDFDETEYKCSMLAYIYTYDGEILSSFVKKLRNQNVLYQFYKQWKNEQDRNFIMLETIMSEENYTFQLTAENNYDYEPIPNFVYVPRVKYPPITNAINVGCFCKKKCNKYSYCCPQLKGWDFIYNEVDERINVKEHQMIVECNDFCSCDASCPNRPKPITVKLCIFKTANRGWGVKACENIPSGKFICEYTGEFLNKTEARKRARQYHKSGNTYLFDLDYNDKTTATYSIDATYQGNISRFINHSCNANLQTWPASTCNLDPRMHKLYYFSQRYIRAGEELCVDYTGGRKVSNAEDTATTVCQCGSSSCKGFIF